MGEIVVVAQMKVGERHEDEVVQGLREVAAQTHEEPGCLLYALHRAADDPEKIVLIERWESRDALQEHLGKPYIQELAQRADLLAEPLQVSFLEPLPAGEEAKGRL